MINATKLARDSDDGLFVFLAMLEPRIGNTAFRLSHSHFCKVTVYVRWKCWVL